MKTFKGILLFGCVMVIMGCKQIRGTYMAAGQAHFDKIVFTSAHKVELVFLGSVVEADYKKEGNLVKINTAMGWQVLHLTDDDCLDGGFIMGKYCKE